MQARSKLKPGQKETKKLVELYGARLVCVRPRDDEQLQKRFKTVEQIVEEAPWTPNWQVHQQGWRAAKPRPVKGASLKA